MVHYSNNSLHNYMIVSMIFKPSVVWSEHFYWSAPEHLLPICLQYGKHQIVPQLLRCRWTRMTFNILHKASQSAGYLFSKTAKHSPKISRQRNLQQLNSYSCIHRQTHSHIYIHINVYINPTDAIYHKQAQSSYTVIWN